MIIRIVKMRFRKGTITPFLAFLSGHISKIKASPGCSFLQVLRDVHEPNTLMTVSHWESEDYLNEYRHSDLFKYVWSQTKIHFAAPPEAISLAEVLN